MKIIQKTKKIKAEYNKLAPSEADLNTNVNPNEISNIIINTNATQVSNKYDQIDNAIKSNFVPQNNNLTFFESLDNSGLKE